MGKGRNRARYNIDNINQETISNELSLLNLGDTEGLNIKIPFQAQWNTTARRPNGWLLTLLDRPK